MPKRTLSHLFGNSLLYQLIVIMAGLLERKVALKWYGRDTPNYGMGDLVVSSQ